MSTNLLDSGLALLLDEVDEPIGRSVVRGHLSTAIKLRLYFLSQLLSQLHSAKKGREGKGREEWYEEGSNVATEIPEPTQRYSQPSPK